MWWKFSTAEHDSSQVKLIYVKIHLKSELMSDILMFINHSCFLELQRSPYSVLGWILPLLCMLCGLTLESRLQHLTFI